MISVLPYVKQPAKLLISSKLIRQGENTPFITPLYSPLKLSRCDSKPRGEEGGLQKIFRKACLFNYGLLNNSKV